MNKGDTVFMFLTIILYLITIAIIAKKFIIDNIIILYNMRKIRKDKQAIITKNKDKIVIFNTLSVYTDVLIGRNSQEDIKMGENVTTQFMNYDVWDYAYAPRLCIEPNLLLIGDIKYYLHEGYWTKEII